MYLERMTKMRKRKLFLYLFIVFIAVLAGCAKGNKDADNKEKITIGYFPNINHVAGMVAEEEKMYESEMPNGIKVEYQYFPDGSAFMTALETGEIEGGLVGPGPAMNHFASGAKINIVAGGSTGGTVIMARNKAGIESPKDLANKTFISPRVGCTHNVQFEAQMKKEYNLTSDRVQGKMKHVTGKPATYHSMFISEKIDVATVPEPWASVIEAEGSGKVLIDTPEVAWGEILPAAVFVTSQDLAKNNQELVQHMVNAHQQATAFIQDNPEKAKTIAIKKIADITEQKLSKQVIDKAWKRIDFTSEVDSDVLQDFSNASYDLEFLKDKPNLKGLVDTQFLQ